MKDKKSLENRIRGWLPKEPLVENPFRIASSRNSVLRFSSILFPALGMVLIALFCYSSLLVFYSIQISLSSYWLLFAGYLVGVELAIIGATIRAKLNYESQSLVRKPFLVVGLSFLTFSVLGFIFDRFFGALNMTYPFSLHSLLVKLIIFWRVGWVSPVFLCFGFAGWVLLLASRSLSSKSSATGWRYPKEFYILTVGSIIIIAGILIEVLSLLSTTAFLLLQPLLYPFYAFLNPLGILLLTFGWVTVVSSHAKKKPIIFPVLFAVFVATTLVLFLIPI